MHCGKRQRLNILRCFVVVVVFYFHLKTFFLQFCFVHGFLVKRVDKNSLKKNQSLLASQNINSACSVNSEPFTFCATVPGERIKDKFTFTFTNSDLLVWRVLCCLLSYTFVQALNTAVYRLCVFELSCGKFRNILFCWKPLNLLN